MRRRLRQREAVVAIGLLLSVFGSSVASAADPKLFVKCQEPAKPSGAGQGTVTCDVRASGAAVFKELKATIKGEKEPLETKLEAFNPAEQSTTTAYLIQILPNNRRTTLAQMGDAVVTFTDQRVGKRRFMAYTFANDLALVADSGTSKAEFVRQIIAIKPLTATIQLYKTALQAVEALAKETGDRKALVILADGTSDDTGYSHDQVVKAAKDAGVVIHVLGYYDDRSARPQFQKLIRLAEDTGGSAVEVKQGPATKDFAKDVVTNRFAGEVLENGGKAVVTLKGAAGAQTIEFKADLTDGKTLVAEEKVTVPAAAPPSYDRPAFERAPEPEPEPAGVLGSITDWAEDNSFIVVALGVLLGGGIVAFAAFGQQILGRVRGDGSVLAGPADPLQAGTYDDNDDPMTQDGGEGELLRDADGRPVVYGWLEMLDGNASRHPLRTTNVRVGRHRDNDICLQNDSISRRHAVLHYNADTRRFVITDLGGGNGVVVNKTKYKSRELSDGDMVELGEVRLRFRAETEFLT
jgi:hypothetical protein